MLQHPSEKQLPALRTLSRPRGRQ